MATKNVKISAAKSAEKKTAATRKTAVKKAVVKKAEPAAAKKAVVKKAEPVAKKAVVKKAEPVAVKKAVAKKAEPVAVKKAVVKKAEPVAKKAVAKKAEPVAVKKAVAKKAEPAAAKKAVAKKAAPVAKAEPVAKKPAKRGTRRDELLKKLKLSKADKKFFYELLMNARSSFGEQFKFHTDDALSSRKDSAGERAGMATHMADLGSDNFRHDLELGLLSEEGDVILMIDEALQKIENNEYGICIECGCEISPARLEAKPYARFCTKCKAMYEEMEDPSRRHR